jgi:CheY-like chemotaxis protein
VSVTDGVTALVRLEDVDPDLILADVSLPGKSGYEICEYVKNHARHRRAGVLLTAGALEAIDELEARRVRADGSLRKPFEASVVLDAVKRLVEDTRHPPEPETETGAPPEVPPSPPVPETVLEAPPAVPPEVQPEAAPEEPQQGPASAGAAGAGPAQSLPAARPAVDPQAVRAAVTLALEAALPVLIDEVTERVLLALAEETGSPEEPAGGD